MIDQASKLRNMIVNKQQEEANSVKIYSILSGKGGVGKTNFAVNLAIKLQQMGKRVLILDGDIGMSNANIILGVDSLITLSHMIDEGLPLEDVILEGPEGVHLISGGADLLLMETLDEERSKSILDSLNELGVYDIIIIDNGAGISKQSLTFSLFAHEIILITTPEPTALTDAYRVLKVTSTHKLKDKINLVINQIHSKDEGEIAFNKLKVTSERFLNVRLEKLGFIYNDSRMNKAIMDQVPIVLKYPKALASINLSDISQNIISDKDYEFNISNFKEFSSRIKRFFG